MKQDFLNKAKEFQKGRLMAFYELYEIISLMQQADISDIPSDKPGLADIMTEG